MLSITIVRIFNSYRNSLDLHDRNELLIQFKHEIGLSETMPDE